MAADIEKTVQPTLGVAQDDDWNTTNLAHDVIAGLCHQALRSHNLPAGREHRFLVTDESRLADIMLRLERSGQGESVGNLWRGWGQIIHAATLGPMPGLAKYRRIPAFRTAWR